MYIKDREENKEKLSRDVDIMATMRAKVLEAWSIIIALILKCLSDSKGKNTQFIKQSAKSLQPTQTNPSWKTSSDKTETSLQERWHLWTGGRSDAPYCQRRPRLQERRWQRRRRRRIRRQRFGKYWEKRTSNSPKCSADCISHTAPMTFFKLVSSIIRISMSVLRDHHAMELKPSVITASVSPRQSQVSAG